MLFEPHDGTVAALVRELASVRPSAPAILAPRRPPLDYWGLWHQIEVVAGALRSLGATKHDRVAIVLPNGPEMATAFIGVAANAACAPLNPGYGADELRFYLQDTCARAVVALKGDRGPLPAVAHELGLPMLEVEADAAAPAGRFRIPNAAGGAHARRVPHPGRHRPRAAHLRHHGAAEDRAAEPRNLIASARNIARTSH